MTGRRSPSERGTNRSTGPSSEPRRALRRRGEVLEAAIREAALAELAEQTFDGFSIERVAQRAQTGKAAIYRRWPTKLELILDTLANGFPDPTAPESTGDLRTDLVRFLRGLAAALQGPFGAALRANAGKHHEHPELAQTLRARVIAPQDNALLELLQAAVARGEVRAAAATTELAAIGPALVRQHFIEAGRPPTRKAIEAIVDNALIPMLAGVGRPTSATPAREHTADS